MKVVCKSKILEVLKNGGFIKYQTIFDNTIILLDNNKKNVGIVRFDTFLKLPISKSDVSYMFDYYTLKVEEKNEIN